MFPEDQSGSARSSKPHDLDAATNDDVDIEAIRRRVPALDGRRPVLIRQALLGPDVLGRLPVVVRTMARKGPVVMLVDSTPMNRGQVDLKRHILTLLGPGATTVTLGVAGVAVHADEDTIAIAKAAVREAGCVVAVGSGTICDIGKKATEGPEGPSLVVVQTASSVNAFADDLAVLLLRGAKRTVPSRWPDALIIDIGVIADAPTVLNQAGLGDLMAAFTAPADWLLADQLGQGGSAFDVRIIDLVRDGIDRSLEMAPGIGHADEAALSWLSQRLMLSAIAMGIAGRTAPASGSEHAVSHLLEMAAAQQGRPDGLHGAKVGVASIVMAALWEGVIERFDVGRILDDPLPAGAAAARVREAFDHLDGTGKLSAECWRLYQGKLAAWADDRGVRQAVVDGWAGHREELRRLLVSPEEIAAILRAAGAPTRFSELDPPPGDDAARWAISSAHLLRDRFGVLDLVDLAGMWQPSDVDGILARASAAGGGL